MTCTLGILLTYTFVHSLHTHVHDTTHCTYTLHTIQTHTYTQPNLEILDLSFNKLTSLEGIKVIHHSYSVIRFLKIPNFKSHDYSTKDHSLI